MKNPIVKPGTRCLRTCAIAWFASAAVIGSASATEITGDLGDALAAQRSESALAPLLPATSVSVTPASPTIVINCIPFGTNTGFGWSGFLYRDVPAFEMPAGATIRFDLGSTNDRAVQRNIFFAATNINPAPAVTAGNSVVSQGVTVDANGWVQVVQESQVPLNPVGNNVSGDYELTYTADGAFSFPGGGLAIGFQGSPPATEADGGCDQVLVATDSDDAHGGFYARFCNMGDQPLGVLDDGPCGGTAIRLGGFILEDLESLTKEIVGGNDLDDDGEIDLVVEVGILEPSTYDFKLTYNGPGGVLIEDAIPAEWDVMIPDAADPLENGDFETGDFTGWNQINQDFGGIVIDDGTFDPPGPGGPTPTFEGSYGSATFQSGFGLHTLWRDVDVPEYGMPTLVWADNIQNWHTDFVVPNQQWRVEVWDPSDNSVMAVLRETLPGDPTLQDWAVYTADLSPWAGETVRIAFTEQDSFFFFNARLDAVDVVNDPNQLNCVLTYANGNGGSATLADCFPEGSGMTWFWTMARCHDTGRNQKCRPTSCGPLYLNDGAAAYEEWEGPNRKGQYEGIGDPFLVSNSLCLAAVEDLNGGGLVYDGTGDEDEDGIPDYAEACEGVTDVCNPDTDGDGVLDGADECPLEGPPDASIGEVQDPNGCNRQSQCSDGVDNDDDGPIDFPDDASCDSNVDDSEDTVDCPCWNSNDLLSVTADNQRDPISDPTSSGSCSTYTGGLDALIQNLIASTPGVEGGFAADVPTSQCQTRDFPPFVLAITADEAQNCVDQIKARCAAIGDPVPLAGPAAAAAAIAGGNPFDVD